MKTGSLAAAAVAAILTLVTPAEAFQDPKVDSIIWGKSLDGLQVGLELAGAKTVYRPGDVLGIRIHLRNTGDAPLKLALKSPRSWHANLSSSGLITMSTNPDDSEETFLEAGESTQAGAMAEFVIVPPGAAVEKGVKALMLAGGEYRIRMTTPLWTQDPEDRNRATGLRSTPGPITIKVLGDTLRIHGGRTRTFRVGSGVPRSAEPEKGSPKSVQVSRTEPAWGDPINGIQAGIRYKVTGSAIRIGSSVKTELLVRNITESPITISYPAYASYDFHPMLKNAKGETVNVHSVFVSGLRRMASDTIAPGEAIVIGEPVIELVMKRRAGESWNPVAETAPGKYRILYHISVQPVGSIDLILMTGTLDLDVRPAPIASSQQ